MTGCTGHHRPPRNITTFPKPSGLGLDLYGDCPVCGKRIRLDTAEEIPFHIWQQVQHPSHPERWPPCNDPYCTVC